LKTCVAATVRAESRWGAKCDPKNSPRRYSGAATGTRARNVKHRASPVQNVISTTLQDAASRRGPPWMEKLAAPAIALLRDQPVPQISA